MFKESPEGQTHFYNDGCGEPEHNNLKEILEKRLKYCREQNGLPYCKTCNLCEEDVLLLKEEKKKWVQEGYERGRLKCLQQHDYCYKPGLLKEILEEYDKCMSACSYCTNGLYISYEEAKQIIQKRLTS